MATPTIPTAEFDAWQLTRDENLAEKSEALLGTSTIAPGGSSVASISAAYKNQQGGAQAADLKIDAEYSIINYDMFKGETAPQGYPTTTVTEQAILDAALTSKYRYADTIPAQVMLSLMQASRRAHNNWRQRRQQLLTHRQMLAANRVAINDDLAKLVAGQNLDGVVDINGP